jgi:Uma2 family endonuclease
MVEPAMTKPIQAAPTAPLWPEQGQWTYEDWLHLPADGYRYKVLDGELHMSPPSAIQHQSASGTLFAAMHAFAARRRLGKVLAAPCGVRLPGQPVPVQPDIFFVSAARKNIIFAD